MRNKKLRVAAYGIPILVLVVIALLYGKMPEHIPTHWDVDGTVSYGGKAEIWMVGGMGLLFAVLMDVVPRIDPRRRNYEKFGRYYDGFCLGMQVFMAAMSGMILSESLFPGRISVGRVTAGLLGILFVGIGNVMPKFKSNFYMGIKTPWTLSSDWIWHKTHRLGGKLFVAAGAVTVLAAVFLPLQPAFYVCLASLAAAGTIPSICSYLWWRGENGSKGFTK